MKKNTSLQFWWGQNKDIQLDTFVFSLLVFLSKEKTRPSKSLFDYKKYFFECVGNAIGLTLYKSIALYFEHRYDTLEYCLDVKDNPNNVNRLVYCVC
ncbi:hypothetical protein [Aquimarina sediminis]|uniref:hypothetical protein n=1 Tax=Aquimarina sediminis TaxID=2070536 RepID=UPI000CA02858|nr:hypothetical protein [Aquimarina sediminis]